MSHLLHLVSRTALLAATVVTSLMCRQAVADDAVLLASTVPGYAPGMVVAPTDRLSLPDGASATLLFQSGEMLRLRGPFEGTLEQQQAGSGSGSIALLADMFRVHGVDATVIGGTRSAGAAQSRLTIDDVQVDSQRSGTYCVQADTSVWISRPVGESGAYALRRKGSSRKIAWPSGAARIEWPVDVPIEDGSQFEITSDGAAHATVTFRALGEVSGSANAKVARGIALGCHEQFDALLHQMSRSVINPELWMTTDHGRRPTYRAGEAIALTIAANLDGYLYCVAAKDDGNALPIFPAGAVDGAQIRASMPLVLPGRRQTVGLTATSGVEQIHCWLADRDISPELPHALLGPPTGRLPDQFATDLDSLFSHIGGTRIASDTLTIKGE